MPSSRLVDVAAWMVTRLQLRGVVRHLVDRSPGAVRRWAHGARLGWRIRHRRRLVPEKALEEMYGAAWSHVIDRVGRDRLGDYLEFGVYNGTSLVCMQRVLRKLHLSRVRLFGFDSFAGLPADAARHDGGHWVPGQFRCDEEFARQVLDHHGTDWRRTVLVTGFFADTLTPRTRERLRIGKASVVMIDCDLGPSAETALRFCAPLIRDEAVILFDDWYPLADRGLGERAAFDRFLADHPQFEARDFATYGVCGRVFAVSNRAAALNAAASEPAGGRRWP